MEKQYNRKKVIQYAEKWAYKRNPKYYNFDVLGGDCTNFASQCVYNGAEVMNYTEINGWFYKNGKNKSPSWTGVEFIYRFLVNNKRKGPVGKEVSSSNVYPGDIAQLSFDGKIFSHTLIILNHSENLSEIKVAAHTYDTYGKKIIEYNYNKIRFVNIYKVLI